MAVWLCCVRFVSIIITVSLVQYNKKSDKYSFSLQVKSNIYGKHTQEKWTMVEQQQQQRAIYWTRVVGWFSSESLSWEQVYFASLTFLITGFLYASVGDSERVPHACVRVCVLFTLARVSHFHFTQIFHLNTNIHTHSLTMIHIQRLEQVHTQPVGLSSYVRLCSVLTQIHRKNVAYFFPFHWVSPASHYLSIRS